MRLSRQVVGSANALEGERRKKIKAASGAYALKTPSDSTVLSLGAVGPSDDDDDLLAHHSQTK